METPVPRSWVEIDKAAIGQNYAAFRGLISPQTRLMAVVKSNAYGHCLVPFAMEMESLGADWLGVDAVEEAKELREAGIKLPILVLGSTLPQNFALAAELGVSITVSNIAALKAACAHAGRPLQIHIKADTGLNRQGFLDTDMEAVVPMLKAAPKDLIIEGLYTHFAAAESPSSEYSLKQLERFAAWTETFDEAGLKVLKHTAGTAATIVLPQSHFDMVRVGIGMYGLWPSPEVKVHAGNRITLHPTLSWKALVGDVKRVPKGSKVGYDLTETLSKDSVLAVIGIGYWHGFPRSLSSVGEVLVRGKRVKLVGRVSMDMAVADVTDIEGVVAGDEAVIIGTSGNETIPAEEVAKKAGTINYEFVTRINPGIVRVFK